MIKWDDIRSNTKVILNKPFKFNGFDGVECLMPSGTYYINGFWGNACGLRTTHKIQEKSFNEFVINARDLVYFEGIED